MSRAALIAALILLLLPLRAIAESANNPADLLRTWQQAVVYVPVLHGKARQIPTASLPGFLQRYGNPKVVLYAHGCSGINDIGHSVGKLYAQNGFVFIAPDSFARGNKPVSCRPALYQGGLHRRVLTWRQAELAHALTRLRALPGLARAPVALIGHSEGGIAVATFKGGKVSARVIEGWTCHARWPEYKGLNAPRREPVLALVGQNDPWFQRPELRGDCSAYMDGNDRSFVFRRPDRLHNKHWLIKDKRVRQVILNFLARHMLERAEAIQPCFCIDKRGETLWSPKSEAHYIIHITPPLDEKPRAATDTGWAQLREFLDTTA